MFDTGIFNRVRIFHIAEPSAWAARDGTYTPDDFGHEGFIHCATADQLPQVTARFYPGRDDLVLLTIETSEIEDMVVFEDLYKLGEVFPHIYGHLPLAAVVKNSPYSAI